MTVTTINGRLVRIPAPPRPVGFLDAVQLFYRRYFVILGRSSRSEYWYGFLFVNGLQVVLAAIYLLVGGSSLLSYLSGTLSSESGAAAVVVDNVGWVLGWVHAIPAITAGVRRLHDAGLSGWVLLIVILPVLGPIILVVLLVKRSAPLAREFAHLGYDWEDDKRFAEPFSAAPHQENTQVSPPTVR